MGAGRSLEPEDCRVEMIRMKMRYKYEQRLIFRNARERTFLIVKEPDAFRPFHEEAAVADIGYFHNINSSYGLYLKKV